MVDEQGSECPAEETKIIFDSRTMNLRVSQLMGSYGITIEVTPKKIRNKRLGYEILYYRLKGNQKRKEVKK